MCHDFPFFFPFFARTPRSFSPPVYHGILSDAPTTWLESWVIPLRG